VLDDLALLQAEEVSRGCTPVFWRGPKQAVGHYHVALGQGALDLETHLGELLGETLNETDERLEAVGGLGVVLDVVRTTVLLCRLGGLPLVEGHVVVGDNRLLVGLGVGHRSSLVLRFRS
jgi:hypothetical protein